MSVPNHRFVPLFEMIEGGIVQTKSHGPQQRKLLCRSHLMEQAVINCIETGLKESSWTGMLYVMGWGSGALFRPLYIGKTERKGVKKPLSSNIANIRRNFAKFARWGDGSDYHIGDLSQAMFEFESYKPPTKKYKRWATVMFESFDPPQLKELVYLYIAPWYETSCGPSGLIGSLPSAEKEVIALASVQFSDSLLNVDGV